MYYKGEGKSKRTTYGWPCTDPPRYNGGRRHRIYVFKNMPQKTFISTNVIGWDYTAHGLFSKASKTHHRGSRGPQEVHSALYALPLIPGKFLGTLDTKWSPRQEVTAHLPNRDTTHRGSNTRKNLNLLCGTLVSTSPGTLTDHINQQWVSSGLTSADTYYMLNSEWLLLNAS